MDIAALLSTNIGITVLMALSLWMNLILPKLYRPRILTIVGAAVSILVLATASFLSILHI
jgi:hypothetical protein